MSSYDNWLSDWLDCEELVDFLLSKENDNLVIYYHEIGPVTAFRYKGYHFYLKYLKDHFARITSSGTIGDEAKAIENLYELGNLVTGMIGNPIAYYEESFMDNGVEKKYPTLEWCLKEQQIDEYIRSIVNDNLYDDGSHCLNVKLLNGRNIEDYKKAPQLSLKK